jgi:hypothetical protein
MDEEVKRPKVTLTKGAWLWLGMLSLAMVSTWPLGHFDDATELTPDHSDILEYCFWLAGAVAVASVPFSFLRSNGKLLSRLVLSIFGFGLIGFIATLSVASTVANIVENQLDFPSGKTQTSWTLLPIERAYRMESRTGSSWIIQPAPIWSNIDIAHSDYRLIIDRSNFSRDPEPSSLPSRSYFCAKVMMQRSGNALRVLHAGKQALPPGSLGVCSEMAAREPSLPILR